MDQQLERDGFALLGGVIEQALLERLRSIVDGVAGRHVHNGRTYAARNLLQTPEIGQLARMQPIACVVRQTLQERSNPDLSDNGAGAVYAVRGLLFNKIAEANWSVPWHQDLTIAVRERREAPGFGPWSVKDGVVHVQPPDEVIARMLAVRVHLDDVDAANGALRVIPGSHTAGRLSAEAVARWVTTHEPITIQAPAGSVLFMRPHLLHASSPAERPAQRRVIHIEYAAGPLPYGLDWNKSIRSAEPPNPRLGTKYCVRGIVGTGP